ncbi:MAG: extracellular solute-binding protein, partial [Candidatus Roseilinea sp.]|uniref:extracellular solute-binding protein n=1 Tax=Candidatus Roseilinea sp. TaxID=2838777 RepID=UPI004049715C
MNPRRKFLGIVSAVVLVVSATACAAPEPPAPEPSAPQPAASQPTAAPPAEPAQAAQPTSPPQPTEPAKSAERLTLRYANWNLGTEEENNIQRQLVKAYMDANPHVTVEFVDMSAEGGWEANLTNYAAKGQLPDVFMANNVPLYVKNGWLADLTSLVEQDAD